MIYIALQIQLCQTFSDPDYVDLMGEAIYVNVESAISIDHIESYLNRDIGTDILNEQFMVRDRTLCAVRIV